MSQAPLVLLGCLALSFIDISFYTSKMVLDLFLTWPGSRKQEAEADYIGLSMQWHSKRFHVSLADPRIVMMAEGCYRPEAAMEFWTRMEQTGQQAPPQVLSTHPSNHNREAKIREW
jgi:hypothetical protein